MTQGTPMNRSPRGYIMLEAAIGGVMVAVAVFAMLVSLSDGRTKNIIGGRDVIASQLALDKVELQRSTGYANFDAGCAAGELIQYQGFYTRDCVVDGACPSQTMFGATVNCKRITVTVTYSTSLGSRDVTVTSEMYQ